MDENPYAPPSLPHPAKPKRTWSFWLRTLAGAVLWFFVAGTFAWAVTGRVDYGLLAGVAGSLFCLGGWLWIDRGR